jgi:hypothetical protein
MWESSVIRHTQLDGIGTEAPLHAQNENFLDLCDLENNIDDQITVHE